MRFRNFYKEVCKRNTNEPHAKNVCPDETTSGLKEQWWTKEDPYKISNDTIHVPTIFQIGSKPFFAKDLTNENRTHTFRLFEAYALEIVEQNFKVRFTNIISSKVIDIHAEPLPCYPLKVLVEVIIDVK